MPAFRRVQKVVTSVRVVDGDGLIYKRAMPHPDLAMVDPLLGLDELGPMDGGFETEVARRGFHHLTYVLDGAMETDDSREHHALLRRGDVQVQSLGTGLTANEHATGYVHALQIWFNQTKDEKASAPRTVELRSSDLPIGFADPSGGVPRAEVRIVAGETLGLVSPTPFPGFVLHVKLQPRGVFVHRVLPRSMAAAYVIEGAGSFDATKVARAGQLVWFDTTGDGVRIENPQQSVNTLECILVGGVPVGDLVRRHGSLIAASDEGLIAAVKDLGAGRIV